MRMRWGWKEQQVRPTRRGGDSHFAGPWWHHAFSVEVVTRRGRCRVNGMPQVPSTRRERKKRDACDGGQVWPSEEEKRMLLWVEEEARGSKSRASRNLAMGEGSGKRGKRFGRVEEEGVDVIPCWRRQEETSPRRRRALRLSPKTGQDRPGQGQTGQRGKEPWLGLALVRSSAYRALR